MKTAMITLSGYMLMMWCTAQEYRDMPSEDKNNGKIDFSALKLSSN